MAEISLDPFSILKILEQRQKQIILTVDMTEFAPRMKVMYSLVSQAMRACSNTVMTRLKKPCRINLSPFALILPPSLATLQE